MSLQNNTTGLESILETVNALPEATAPPVLEALAVTPSTQQQSITPPDGVDGYNSVNVEAVTASIDPNIVPENIAKDEVILGVVGTHEGGRAPVEEKDVCLFDYDGTLLYSYTVEEVQALTELPEPPEHEGLVFDGWNWTLEELKGLNGPMDVGAYYDTFDGRMRLYITVDDPENMPITMGYANYDYNVDWGDGSISTIGETHEHTYVAPGDYVVTLWCDDSTKFLFNTFCSGKHPSKCTLRKLEVGSMCERIWSGSFASCHNLEVFAHTGAVSIYSTSFNYTGLTIYIAERDAVLSSQTIRNVPIKHILFSPITTTIGNYFHDSSPVPMRRVCIPPSLTNIGNGFEYSTKVNNVTIPEDITTLNAWFLRNCDALTTIIVPAGVTSIGDYSFYDCESLCEVRMLPTIPPTLGGTNAFKGGYADRIIYVPVGSLEAYQTATNWSAYASQMREEGT